MSGIRSSEKWPQQDAGGENGVVVGTKVVVPPSAEYFPKVDFPPHPAFAPRNLPAADGGGRRCG